MMLLPSGGSSVCSEKPNEIEYAQTLYSCKIKHCNDFNTTIEPQKTGFQKWFLSLASEKPGIPSAPCPTFYSLSFFLRSSFGNALVTPSAALGKPFLPASPSLPHSFLIRDKIQKGILSRLRGCWDEEANGLTFVISVFPLIRPVCLHLASNPLFRSGFPCVPRYMPREIFFAKKVVRIL